MSRCLRDGKDTYSGPLPRLPMKKSAFIPLCLLILPLCHTMAQDRVVLRPHWAPGKVYKQQTETQTTSTFTVAPGETKEQKLNVIQGTSITVSGTPQEKLARVTFESMKGEMSMLGQTHKYDSADPITAHPLLRQALGGTVGKTFTIVYDADDRYTAVRDTEKLGADPGTGNVPLAGVAEAEQIATLFRQSLEIGLSKMPVGPGDTWVSEESMKFPQAGAMKATLNSKYDSIVDRDGRKHAKIFFDGKIGSVALAPGEKAPNATISPDSTISGQVFFDLERRTVSLSVFLANLTLDLAGNRIPLRQQVTTRLLSMEDAK
jgi:hypothetical protein